LTIHEVVKTHCKLVLFDLNTNGSHCTWVAMWTYSERVQ